MAPKWWTLLAACTATFMLLLDITIVNVALPAIQRDLGSSFEDLQWVVDAYALTLAALLLTSGSLADRLGRRRVFATGLAFFTVASLLCGLAGTPDVLTAARGLQGVGGAVMFATSLSLLATAFSGRERGTAFGVWGATTGAAVAVGPLVGGALTQGLGWEWIFFLDLPIGVATLGVTVTRLRESHDPGAGGVDLPGVLTFSDALGLLVFALIRGNAEGWGSPLIVTMLAGAGVLLVAFVAIEVRRRDPMLEPSLFRRPAFAGASAVAFTLSASIFAMFLYIVLYLQNVLGYVGDGQRIRSVHTADLAEAGPALRVFLDLLTEVRIVVLLGRKAVDGWARAEVLLPALIAPHPSPRVTNARPEARDHIRRVLGEARRLAGFA